MKRSMLPKLHVGWLGAVGVVLLILMGCDRRAPVAGGTYAVVPATAGFRSSQPEPQPVSSATGIPALVTIFVDRDNETTWLHFAGGSIFIAGHTAWPAALWPSGCPANLGSTRMEVLILPWDRLAIGGATIRDPLLVRDCPAEPVTLVLRDAGKIGGAGTACTGAEMCVPLARTADDRRLPVSANPGGSMKGYELYSWQEAATAAWTYTLMTGTNRNKTWAEVASPSSTMSPDGARHTTVKITVVGTAPLKSVLGRLPAGAEVFWIGPGDPHASADLAGHIELPDARVIRDLRSYARRLDLSLHVGD